METAALQPLSPVFVTRSGRRGLAERLTASAAARTPGVRRLALALCLLVLAGCGAERQRAPGISIPRSPGGFQAAAFPAAGVKIDAPRGWGLTRLALPAVFTSASGDAQLSAFAYRREQPLPTPARLDDARRELVRLARRRNRSFALLEASTTRIGDVPAVAVVGEQTIGRRQVRTLSVHLYRGNVEYVFEGLATLAHFDRVDREVFGPAIGSVRVTGRIRRPRR